MKRSMAARACPRTLVFLLALTMLMAMITVPMAQNASGDSSKNLGDMVRKLGVKGDGEHYLGALPTREGVEAPKIEVPKALSLPATVDLSSDLPPVGDQGSQGSCTGFSTSYYYKTWMEKQDHGWAVTDQKHIFSPSFVYNQINNCGTDSGAPIYEAMWLVETRGDIDIQQYAYTQYSCSRQPTLNELNAAKPYRIPHTWAAFWDHSERVYPYSGDPIEDLKTWLSSGKPLVWSIPIFQDFPDYNGNPDAHYYDYNGTAALDGAHALCVVGYDDNVNSGGLNPDHRGGFKVVNSWGSSWNGADSGFVYISYDFARHYVNNAFSEEDITPDTPSVTSVSSTTVSPGAPIGIAGSNLGSFRGSAQVTISGKVADLSPTAWTNEEITAYVPVDGTSGPLVVTDWEGNTTTPVEITVPATVGPAPTVTSVTPNKAQNRGPVDLVVRGTNFRPGAQVSLSAGLLEATNESVVSSTQINCKVNLYSTSAVTHHVTVMNPDGSSGTRSSGFVVSEMADTYENNSDFYSAYGPLKPGTAYWSYCWSKGDDDYYKIEIPGGTARITAHLRNIPVCCDYDLYLCNSSGEIVENSLEPYHNDETISYSDYPNLLDAGTYYLVVVQFNNCSQVSPYKLDFSYTKVTPKITSISPTYGYGGRYAAGTAVTITGAYFGKERGSSVVKFNGLACIYSQYSYENGYIEWSNGKLVVLVPFGATTGPVKVITPWGTSNSKTFTVPVVFFAGGTCRPGFDQYICIQNPGDKDANITINYTRDQDTHQRVPAIQSFTVKKHSRVTVRPKDVVGEGDTGEFDFTTSVECTNGQRVICERPTYFDYKGWTGGHDVVGAIPAKAFYFAEGTCRPGFDPYLRIQTPGIGSQEVYITYMRGDGTTYFQKIGIPGSSLTVRVKDVLGEGDDPSHDFSVKVECSSPCVVERPMYFNYRGIWTGGHDVVGATSPSSVFYFAEGTCRPGFDPYLCIQNPGGTDAAVRITYMKGDGTTDTQDMTIGKNSRRTVNVKDRLGSGDDAAHDFSAKVECTNGQKIIAERPMYFNYKGVWNGGHDVVGATSPSTSFYFAEGTCRPGFDTYLCLQNPGGADAAVKITYMKGDGTTDTEDLTVKKNSRSTVTVKNKLGEYDNAAHDFSAKVECTNGQKIICERPMYFNYKGIWTGGHDVVGFKP